MLIRTETLATPPERTETPPANDGKLEMVSQRLRDEHVDVPVENKNARGSLEKLRDFIARGGGTAPPVINDDTDCNRHRL